MYRALMMCATDQQQQQPTTVTNHRPDRPGPNQDKDRKPTVRAHHPHHPLPTATHLTTLHRHWPWLRLMHGSIFLNRPQFTPEDEGGCEGCDDGWNDGGDVLTVGGAVVGVPAPPAPDPWPGAPPNDCPSDPAHGWMLLTSNDAPGPELTEK